MQKIILYVVIIVVLTGAILAGAWFFYIKDSGTEVANTNTDLTNTTNTANVNTSDLPVETEKGDTEVTATVTYKDTQFDFTSVSRVGTWRDQKADSGHEFLVVFFSPIDTNVREATAWIRTDAKLITGANETIRPAQLKVVGTGGSTDDTGYFVFSVKTSDRNFRIGFADTTTALGL